MSNTESTTSVNLATQLAQSGNTKISLVTAVVELALSYIGGSNINSGLLRELRKTKKGVGDLIDQSNTPMNIHASNDEVYDKKAA